MKNIFRVFFGIGAIVIYGLAIGAYSVADQGGKDFLLLGLLAGIYSSLYLLFERVK